HRQLVIQRQAGVVDLAEVSESRSSSCQCRSPGSGRGDRFLLAVEGEYVRRTAVEFGETPRRLRRRVVGTERRAAGAHPVLLLKIDARVYLIERRAAREGVAG